MKCSFCKPISNVLHYLKFELDEKIAAKKNYCGITTDLRDAEQWKQSFMLRSYEIHTDNKYANMCTENCKEPCQ